ncbi:MAG: nucleoside kinase [Lachnospira sp.]|nr:nucleoside kinase [Lachnospira sp.]
MIRIKCKEQWKEYEYDSTKILQSYADEVQSEFAATIVLAYMNGKLCELNNELVDDAQIEFVTTADTIGSQTYRRSAILLMLAAMQEITKDIQQVKVSVNYSVNHALFCELIHPEHVQVTDELLAQLKNAMQELVDENVPIEKENISTDKAIKIFEQRGMMDKVQLFKYRRVSKTNIYSLRDYVDYFYGYMVPSTGYITKFDLIKYENGFMLLLPVKSNPGVIQPFSPQPKLFSVLKQAEQWGDMLEVGTVGALNDLVAKGGMNEMILVQEALMEKNIGDIAKQIVQQGKKVVLIAGPSSSGKTTFSHRLSIQLRANGLRPHPIAMDNYFVNREFTPRDENGDYNFECIDAMDVKQFNEDMSRLVKGETVMMPTFNFKTGKREYKGNTKTIGSGDVLVIEGIHALNPRMSEALSDDEKFCVYISALTQLNIDDHNRIPTTDGRLIRRIVRDAKHRGTAAKDTIAMWHSVRRGEEENIFPYQENADVMFNSALIYEQAVLKQYAEPLLFAIPKEAEEYQEAKRLLKFFDYFLGVDSSPVPNNSIIREFIGGSCFNV